MTGLTITDLKRHLNIESGYTYEDEYLTHLLNLSILSVKNYLNEGYEDLELGEDDEVPLAILHGVLLLAGHWYITRTPVSFSEGKEIPYSLRFLLDPYRNLIVG